MTWFRTIRGFVPWLVGLFLVAQLAGAAPFQGVDSSRHSGLAASHIQHHGHDQGPQGHAHHPGDNHGINPSDQCCALHAFMTAIVPPAIETDLAGPVAERLTAAMPERVSGLAPGRLERPPKPLSLI